MDEDDYSIGAYGYGWLDKKVCSPLGVCKVCDTELVAHMFGAPLKVCPTCFPGEAA